MLKRKELAVGLYLLAVVSGLCLAGLQAVDRALAAKERKQ
jgi:hypothetical protein